MSIAGARIIVGLLLLFLGRRLFWLFVGALGFVGGLEFAARYLPNQTDEVTLIVALIAGLIGMVVAVAIRRFAIGAAGFLAGGVLLVRFMELGGGLPVFPLWMMFLVGGVIGAILMTVLFGWTLILLSSLAGATLIIQSLHLDTGLAEIAFLGLTMIGIFSQGRLRRRIASA